jgi:hypothetical protein
MTLVMANKQALKKCKFCRKEISLMTGSFVAVREYRNGFQSETNLYCSTECLKKDLNKNIR